MTRWYMVTKEPGNQTEDMDRSRRTQFAELVALIKKVSPPSRIGSFLSNIKMKMPIICVYPPVTMEAEEVERLELMVGERCNDMMLDSAQCVEDLYATRAYMYD